MTCGDDETRQALWDSSPNLLQLPGVSAELAKKAAEAEIETIFDLMDMEDDARNELLAMSEAKVVRVRAVSSARAWVL